MVKLGGNEKSLVFSKDTPAGSSERIKQEFNNTSCW